MNRLPMTVATVLVMMPIKFLCAAEPAQKRVESTNPVDGATMVLIGEGSVMVGSDEAEVDEHFRTFGYQSDWKKYALAEIPRHRVTVKPFLLSKYEVTNGQYQKFVAATDHAPPTYWKGKTAPPGKEKHPVVDVSWDDARAYCHWAGGRLPSEVEWEYAARGSASADGTKRGPIFPWGDNWDRSRANSASYHFGKDIVDNAGYQEWSKQNVPASLPLTMPVGSFPNGASPLGILDMAGNAWEWCADPYAPYAGSPQGAPAGDVNSHVAKGGSWANVSFHLRCADRRIFTADTRNLYVGFRCAKEIEAGR